MKVKLISLTLMLFMLVSPSSCDIFDGLFDGSEVVCELLDKLVKEEYSEIVIDVYTTTNGVALQSKYILTSTLVKCQIEQLNKLPEDGNLSGEIPSFKYTIEVTAEIKNGKVVKLDGESVSLPSYNQLKGRFDFNKNNFENIDISESGMFKADVVSPDDFFGATTDARDVKVCVEYSDDYLETIIIDYKTDYSTVQLSYEFTK